MKLGLIVFIFLAISPAFADKPYWVIFQEGKQAVQEHRYSEALILLKEAILRKGFYPEAEYYYALALSGKGDLKIKELQIKEALKKLDYLFIKEEKYEMLYDLASVYAIQENYKESVAILEGIIVDNLAYKTMRNSNNLDQIIKNILDERRDLIGIEHVFLLYKNLESGFASEAHYRLGDIYYKAEAYNLSIVHSSFVFIDHLKKALTSLEYYKPLYNFISLKKFIDDIKPYKEIEHYVYNESHIFSSLYNIGSSLVFLEQMNFTYRGHDTLKLLYDVAPNHYYGQMSLRQLREPKKPNKIVIVNN